MGGSIACPVGPSRLGMCCENGCIDVSNDPKNCGHCDWECGAGEVCQNYGCVDKSDVGTIVY